VNVLRKLKALFLIVALAYSAPRAFAQTTELPGFPDVRIEVTGSRIARTDSETALPVQVLSRDEILRGNFNTASELMAHISANVNGMNSQLSLGQSGNPGLASANLRGLGDGNTLVLLNGRRLSNYAFFGATVDLNSIPLAAIDRVEILKDGASSIYGTDAIAGVINFITRKDFSGVETSGQAGVTQQGGGDHYQATVTAGWGDLTKDRFNAFATVDWQKDARLSAPQRAFSATGYRPEAGLDRSSPMTVPANIGTGEGFLNPAYATGCAPPTSLPHAAAFYSRTPFCIFDPASVTDIVPPAEQWTAIGRATWQFARDHQLFAEYVYARNQLQLSATPTPASGFTTIDSTPVLYPETGPYYPTAFAAANGLSGPLDLFYRTTPLGPRVDEVTTESQRIVVGAQGTVGEWTYGGAYNHSVNRADDTFRSGYVLASRFIPAMFTGLINPFGPLDQVGFDLLASTQFTGKARTSKGTMDLFDAQLSADLLNLPGGPLAVAFGGEWRREKLADQPAPIFDTGDVLGSPFEISPIGANRSVGAAFVEFSIPVSKRFEIGASARYDHYSDFGGTTNPKIALRWQPARALLLRAAWGTGFRAPSLPDLYIQRFDAYQGGFADPLRCPVVPLDCGNGEYLVRLGGNQGLQPETSNQYTAGVIWEPVPGVSFGVEWWKIDKQNVIGVLDPALVLDNYGVYGASHVIRGPVDSAYPAVPGPIQSIIGWNENVGNLSTSGLDVSIKARTSSMALGQFQFTLDGTYIHQFTQHLNGLPSDSVVGAYGAFGAVPRWRHYATLNWSQGPWSGTLAQTFQGGVTEVDPLTCGGDGVCTGTRAVGTYSIWDAQAVYSGFKNTSLAMGIRNLFDTNPPFTTQRDSFQAGYDPAYADPRGRTFYARLTYTFK
jgi:iron complex outermembrane receptor protein